MTSKAETIASQCLRPVLAPLPTGASVQHSERFLEFQSALEFFLPAELGWRYEAFDAFRFAVSRKVGPDEAEFVGLALLISDQAWTPIHLWIRLSPDSDQIDVFECRVGEPGEGASGIVRIPYGSRVVDRFLAQLPNRIESIQWVHRTARN
jgi:hypothetical protein